MKIKKFKIEPNMLKVYERIRTNGIKITNEIKEKVENMTKYICSNLIQPAVVFKTFVGEELNQFKNIIQTNNIARATFMLGTIGEKVEKEISQKEDEIDKSIIDSISNECCERICDFVKEIISESAEKDGYVLADAISIDIKNIYDVLEGKKIGIKMNNGVFSPSYIVAKGIIWMKKKRK